MLLGVSGLMRSELASPIFATYFCDRSPCSNNSVPLSLQCSVDALKNPPAYTGYVQAALGNMRTIEKTSNLVAVSGVWCGNRKNMLLRREGYNRERPGGHEYHQQEYTLYWLTT